MSEDTELDRLKDDQDRAFQRKQDAYQVQDRAWAKRVAAREATDRAYQAKQAAYDVQHAAWEYLQSLRSSYGPRIDWLNLQQQSAFENMKSAFNDAAYAHESGDGASARIYADQGHTYKAEAQEAVAERRQLVDQLREAGARHAATRPAFQQAKADFDKTKADFNRAKADHERARDDFKRAKEEFDRAKKAFQDRQAVVRAERQQRKDDKRSLAQRAGVPHQYLDDVLVSTAPDGTVNIYFGGIGAPDGEGHGHYSMDSAGNVTYRREPFDPHGSENFADYEERQRGILYDRSVSSESPKGARGGYSFREGQGHSTQYYEDGTRVSWDLDEDSEQQNKHWTDQNVPKGKDGRHEPPPHAQ